MRAYYWQNKFQLAIKTAIDFQALDKISESQIEESRLIIARSALAIDSLDIAKRECLLIAAKSKTEAGAEAKYSISYIEFKKGNLDVAEKKIFELLSSSSSYEYWLAKSYILLGDIYVEKGNLFQAKHTYKSIMDNYDGEDLKKIATDKYNAVIVSENLQKEKNSNNINSKINDGNE